jgi:leucyl aminopeptidase
MIALGHYITGAFGNDPALMQSLLQAGQAAGEELWWMPVTDLQKEQLKSDVADLKNSGERWGGAINAAMFLKEFVRELPWVHLDIAGPSLSQKDRGYYNKGATGCAARTLVEFIRRQARTGGGGGGGGALRTNAPAAARAARTAPEPRRKRVSSPSRQTRKAPPPPKGTVRRPGRVPARRSPSRGAR